MRYSRIARVTLATVLLAASVIVSGMEGGCIFDSGSHDPEVRRQELLEIYPPGKTSRQDVQERWAPIKPEFSEARPANGWAGLDRQYIGDYVRNRVMASERRTGKPVFRVDCFYGPDGLFGLCNCWFYYDEHDKVQDAEWNFRSD